jgi:hypothetical protein
MVKYKQQVQDMLSFHEEVFKAFKEIHDKYEKDPKKWQDEFNEKGASIQALIRRWENNLCGKSEGGQYGKFSSSLAEKFQTEIRVHFPKIDFIGMKVKD